ncbi:hypothetical protein AVEN_38144-1 [Araneus ventricosus]|uniref:Uncharacterized protein n=1 Tax=Araneus ventricosus TaxID=182803 RepID=A0A4Y2Q552_ARAVE|nr:hypothetical protein AVEN_38144-1 [Araneus ventricosus]
MMHLSSLFNKISSLARACDDPSRGPHNCKQHSPCPFSPDLTSCDFFPWCYLKSKVYLGGGLDVDDLKGQHITDFLRVHGDKLLSAVENVVYRMHSGPREGWSH